MREVHVERPEFGGGPLVVTTVGMAVADLYSAMAQYAIEFVFLAATPLIGQVIGTGYGRSTNQPAISTYP